MRILRLLSVVALLSASALTAATVAVVFEPDSGPVDFAAAEISAALTRRGDTARSSAPSAYRESRDTAAIRFALLDTPAAQAAIIQRRISAAAELRPEGFSLRVRAGNGRPAEVWILARDAAGLMYGGLEAAEIIRLHGLGRVADLDRNPHFAERGVKFNIPLDARTPSYSDAGESAQQNIATVWDMTFWRDYIDRLARDRFNLVSLWNLHPFPSLVRVPEYPDVALADVQRSTAKWNEYYHTWATGLDAPEILDHVETLKSLTIEEKIAFWREVMRYGRSRNVKFYLITWNIFTNGTGGKYGLTPAIDNPTTADYFRRSVRELLLTYPDLAGIGLTTGENMPDATAAQKEEWAFRTYGQGVLDALALQPDRKLTFIHRQHEAAAAEIARRFAPIFAHPNVTFVYSFKYAEAHVFSSVTQNFHARFLKQIGDQPVLWTLRNDDAYYFRWAAPAFVREFIRNIPSRTTRGFYYGSDQWIWGREFLDLERGTGVSPANPRTSRPLEHDKHWLHWRLWGRLGYDPELSDERIVDFVAARFPGIDAAALLAAWQDASMIYPLVTGFHWGRFDFQWYIEGSKSRPEPAQTPDGFHDVNRFISLPPHPTTDNVSIPHYVAAIRRGETPRGTTPVQLAERLHAHADRALTAVDVFQSRGNDELRHTLEDIRTIAHLGKYYAHKIRAATELALFRATLDPEHRATLASELNASAHHWRTYVSLAAARYQNPVWFNRVGHVDWRELYSSVLYDLITTDSVVSVPSMQPTPGGTILEAETARVDHAPVRDSTPGFTGTGYRDFNGSQGRRWIEWNFEPPAAGRYVLEFRYAMRRHEIAAAALTINGEPAGALTLWPSGGIQSWVWDRKTVTLRAGINTIRLAPPLGPNIDHLNVIALGE